MTREFFNTANDYAIDWKLEESLASRIKMAFSLASVQQNLLEYIGYKNLAPLSVDYDELWLYIKDEKFHTVDDGNGKHTYRRWSHLDGDILLCLNDSGYHLCEPSTDEETKTYKVIEGEYYFLWDNDEYTFLRYITPIGIERYCSKDEFEYIKEENYVAIKYYKKQEHGDSFMSEADRISERPHKDAIISRSKVISHIEVFTYFYKDKIIVEDDDAVIVYDREFNVLFKNGNNYKIWEIGKSSYLIFPFSGIVLDLSDCKKIKLKKNNDDVCFFVKTFNNVFVCYNEIHFPYHSDDDDYGPEPETPVKNSYGHVYDSSFTLLRDFNVMGEISEIKEIGDMIIMIANSSNAKSESIDSCYNIKGPNVTKYVEKTNEYYSIPDISFRRMSGFNDLYVVKAKVPSTDIINFSQHTCAQYIVEKCGVYRGFGWRGDTYERIIECKYDHIVSLPLSNDENVYYVGIIGKDDDYKYDLYINHKIHLSGMPFIKNKSIKLSGNRNFIQFLDNDNRIGVIRDGIILLEPKYKFVRICVKHREKDLNDREECEYLFVVSDGHGEGICSPKGELILPLEYDNIDIDEDLCIVLEKKYGEEYEVGWYDKEKDIICHEEAKMKEGMILLDSDWTRDYVWNGSFRTIWRT